MPPPFCLEAYADAYRRYSATTRTDLGRIRNLIEQRIETSKHLSTPRYPIEMYPSVWMAQPVTRKESVMRSQPYMNEVVLCVREHLPPWIGKNLQTNGG